MYGDSRVLEGPWSSIPDYCTISRPPSQELTQPTRQRSLPTRQSTRPLTPTSPFPTARMGRQTWATDAQGNWLSQRKKGFLATQSKGTTRAFVNSTTEDFIEKWPVAAPTPAELLDAEGNIEAAKKAKLEKQRQVRAVVIPH